MAKHVSHSKKDTTCVCPTLCRRGCSHSYEIDDKRRVGFEPFGFPADRGEELEEAASSWSVPSP
jgi:hypothetical protein